MLGGRVRIILSGAAPLSSHIEGFLKVVACCHVLQGYGTLFSQVIAVLQILFYKNV